MLIINNDLYVRSKEDVIAVRPDIDGITVYLVSGYWCTFASAKPTEDADSLSRMVFYRIMHEDPNREYRFNTTTRGWQS